MALELASDKQIFYLINSKGLKLLMLQNQVALEGENS